MKNIAEFTIIGRIGKVEVLNTATQLSIASNYRRPASGGGQLCRRHPLEQPVMAILPRAPAATSASTLPGRSGDGPGPAAPELLEQDGETRYGVDLIRLDFARLAPRQPENGEASG